MRVEIIGLQDSTVELDLAVIPREGEYLCFIDESGTEIAAITHYIHTHQHSQHIKIQLRSIN